MRLTLLFLCVALTVQAQTPTPEFLAQALKRFPQADTNGDGQLSIEEGRAYLSKIRAGKAGEGKAKGLAPNFADISYGPHARNVLDLWQPKTQKPAPLVIFIHGGGFVSGDKANWRTDPLIKELLDRGAACAAINYRFRDQAPIQDILRDCARAVQFLRYKAGEWRLDKESFVAMGGSGGAGTSLWLATRDDLADPANEDMVLRESSRVKACVLTATQATYDVTRWESFLGEPKAEWLRPNEGPEFYGFRTMEELQSPAAVAILRECDMLSWISKDDGPVFCSVRHSGGPIRDRGHWLHHPKHAEEIQKHCKSVGIPCTVEQQAPREVTLAFLLKNLKMVDAE